VRKRGKWKGQSTQEAHDSEAFLSLTRFHFGDFSPGALSLSRPADPLRSTVSLVSVRNPGRRYSPRVPLTPDGRFRYTPNRPAGWDLRPVGDRRFGRRFGVGPNLHFLSPDLCILAQCTGAVAEEASRMSDPHAPKPLPPNNMRLAGLGMELAGAVVGGCLLGYWVDRRFGTPPWGVVIGASIGVIGGLYNLIRQAVHATSGRIPDSKRDEQPPSGAGL
jgi:F0F1-type ATP synthase assembly protein I